MTDTVTVRRGDFILVLHRFANNPPERPATWEASDGEPQVYWVQENPWAVKWGEDLDYRIVNADGEISEDYRTLVEAAEAMADFILRDREAAP